MSSTEHLAVARAFVEAFAGGAEPEPILALLSDDMNFQMPVDPSVFPWLGQSVGRSGVRSLLEGLRRVVILERFAVHDILAGEARAVILGDLACRVVTTGKLIETPFAIAIAVTFGRISNFLMLEDSFAVSVAARP